MSRGSIVMVEPLKAAEVNEPLGAVLLVAPRSTAELFHESQQRLAEMTVAARTDKDWDQAYSAWREVRRRLINRARRETGAPKLPNGFFEE